MSASFGDIGAATAMAGRAAAVPAYADAWGAVGIQAGDVTANTFAQLPFLSKTDLIEGAREHPPYGARLAVERDELTSVFVAPGPIYMPFTQADLDNLWDAQARTFAACGFGPGDVVDNTLSHQWVLGGVLVEGGLKRAGCAVVPGGTGNTDLHLESIVGLGITGIVAFPTFLEHLLATASERGIELPLRSASISGELRRSELKAEALRDHGLVVRERYGVSEVGSVAFECTAGTGMHLRDDLLVETVDPVTGEPRELDDPELKELVVTDPARWAMPIVRLRTGDLVEALDLTPCACGRGAPRLRRIAGRTQTIPRVKGMFVVPGQVGDVLRVHGVTARHQLRIERPGGRDRLTIAIERRGSDDPLDHDPLRSALDAALRMRVELIEVERLPDDAALVEDLREIR